MRDAPARHRFRHPSGGTLHDTGRRARRGRAAGRLPRAVRPALRQGAGPGPRLRLPQGADGLPRAQEHRADRPAGRPRRRLGLQKFVSAAPWAYDDVQAEVQALFADELAPSAAGSPIGVVGVIDESGFAKKGAHSAGVARQHNGRLGKEDNCQVGVFLVGVTPAGSALLDHQLFLPEAWCEAGKAAAERRQKAHIPEGSPSAPSRGSPPSWSADGGPGRVGPGLGRRRRGVRQGGIPRRAGAAGAAVRPRGAGEDDRLDGRPGGVRPAVRRPGPDADAPDAGRRSARWPPCVRACRRACGRLQVREGAVGPLVFEFAAVRVWAMRHRKPGPPAWLLIRRSLEDEPELKYYVSNADAETPLATLALVACTRHRWRSSSRTARATWGWRSTRRGRGSAGTTT